MPITDWRLRMPPQPAVLVVALVWTLCLLEAPSEDAAQYLSNFGLLGASGAAGFAAVVRGRRTYGSDRRFWLLLSTGLASWATGQAIWTWYESTGREVPFPSPADWGYLALPPLVAGALLSLPLAPPTLAGRVRSILDGLMIAVALLLASWSLVLGPVLRAGADSMTAQVISLAYPTGDVVVITIVVYAWLRARRVDRPLPVSLSLLGSGLLAFAVADSGFVYTTTVGSYSSGSVIDLGWFSGFVLMLLAALHRPPAEAGSAEHDPVSRPLGSLLPYAAVMAALATSGAEVWRTGQADVVAYWMRTVILVLLVIRQILTLVENNSLARHLEQRVQQRTAELAASKQQFVALVKHSSDVVTVVDASGTITYQSGSCERVLGYCPSDLVGRQVTDLMPPHEAGVLLSALEHAAAEPLRIHAVSTYWHHAEGRLCRVEITITNLLGDADVNGLVLNTRDVTDRVLLEEELTKQAFTDSLTALPNRALFKDRLCRALRQRVGDGTEVTVLFLDLDGFKAVNDTLGHSAGDDLLVQVSDRLRSVVRAEDVVARFGGDEFAVLLEDAPGEEHHVELATRINETIRTPFSVQDERVHVATSIGIARVNEDTTTAEQLLRNADLAMYQAKAQGLGGYAVYAPQMHAGLVERVRLESDLRRAVEQEQFTVQYQPMVSLRSGDITGVEALVRWNHPDRGLLQPEEFIPAAEATGLIREIGSWVLRVSCLQAVHWDRNLGCTPPLRVSVNVSPRQLHHGDLPEQVRTALEMSGLPAERLTLEMTETVLVDHGEQTLSTLRTLRAMGVRLAIDDFGTGYSSLSYLHRFPVDELKIDRSFIERLSSGGDTALVSTMLRMGQSLQLETVAEGIERPQEMLMLRRQGCTTGQGFHFSRPVSAHDIEALIREQNQPGDEAGSLTPA